jgi:hypothetical protein
MRRQRGREGRLEVAPGRTIVGDLPPSSSTTFFVVLAACAITAAPTATDPVKLTMSTSRCELSVTPAVLAPDDEVGDARRVAGLLDELEEAPRRQRRALGRHQDGGAARGEHAAELAGQQEQRVVVGRDRGDHAGGLHPQQARARDRLVEERQPALVAADRPVRATSANQRSCPIAAPTCAASAEVGRRAGLGDDVVDELLAARLEQVAEPVQQIAALDGRERRPRTAVVGALGRADRLLDLPDGGEADVRQQLFGGGVDDAGALAAVAVDPRAVDEAAGGQVLPGPQAGLRFGGDAHLLSLL